MRVYEPLFLGQQIHRAENLLELYALRAYDSIQLASALESNARLVFAGLPAITFVSADTRLLTAAAIEGLATDDPSAVRGDRIAERAASADRSDAAARAVDPHHPRDRPHQQRGDRHGEEPATGSAEQRDAEVP